MKKVYQLIRETGIGNQENRESGVDKGKMNVKDDPPNKFEGLNNPATWWRG